MFPGIDVEIGSIFKYKTKIEEDRRAQHYHSNASKSESIAIDYQRPSQRNIP